MSYQKDVKTFFDVVNNITTSYEVLPKESIIGATNPFMVNRALSNNPDTLFFADEANAFKAVDPYNHYLFYFHSIPKKKRYGKWAKKEEKNLKMEMVKKFYGVSEKRALEYLEILNEDQLNHLENLLSQGGKLGKK